MEPTSDVRVRSMTPLDAPQTVRAALPGSEAVAQQVATSRRSLCRILSGEDPRLLVVTGPCSIHDPAAALDYARRLAALRRELQDHLYIVMRTYFEKPRTTVGWRGLINDPHLDGSFDMATGLRTARSLLLNIAELGLPTATEMLDPISPQYIADLVSLAAIGARTAESQTHRALASGLSMPVAFKNGTSGSVQVAIDAMISARDAHSFFGVDGSGTCCIVKTLGNPDGVLVLRGRHGAPNHRAADIADARQRLEAAGLRATVMVDCSHANSGYDHRRQTEVWDEVLAQRLDGDRAIAGLMLESNLHEGKQKATLPVTALRYGVSITDACIGWEDTEQLLRRTHGRLAATDRP